MKRPPIDPGTRIGPYEIIALLGAGGMGEVYRARDTRLGREVAFKVLPPEFARDPARRQRFLQEAKSASSLNHPNIVTVYEVDTAGEVTFIAMEFVVGRTLHEELRAERRSVGQLLHYAIQIADALAVAHGIGIVHRDIKPANVLVTGKGAVKVVDFGLAKLTEPAQASPDPATTVTIAMAPTEEGTILGTAAYMSPEQAEGKKVDARSDIFSFGAVLYEMLSGRQAFTGGTTISTLAAILTKEPQPVTDFRQIPSDLAQVVERCLRKDPERRLQSMADVKIALTEIKEAIDSGKLPIAPVPAAGSGRSRWLLAIAAAMVVTAGVTAGIMAWQQGRKEAGHAMLFQRLTWDSGLTTDPAISPDGKLIAYASDRGGRGDLDIWVQQTTGGSPIRLTSDEANERQPSFSADGSKIVFRSEREHGGIYVIPALGGDPQRVSSGGFNPKFSPDGRRIAYWTGDQVTASTPSKIYIVPAGGGTPEEIQTGLPFSRHPIWTPDGERLLFWGASPNLGGADWFTIEAKPGARKPVSAGPSTMPNHGRAFVFAYPTGWIGNRVLASIDSSINLGAATDIWSIPISRTDWKISGSPQPITAGIDSARHAGGSASGQIVWAKTEMETNVWSVRADTGAGKLTSEWELLTHGPTPKRRPNISQDGSRVIFDDGPTEVVLDVATGKQRMISRERTYHSSLTMDGKKAAFARLEGRRIALFVDDMSGDVPQRVCADCGMPPAGWSTDQQKILFDAGVPQALGLFNLKTGTKIDLLRQPGRAFTQASFAPGDRWILFLAGAGPGRQQVFVMPYSEGAAVPKEEAWIPITDGKALDSQPRWSPDGKVVYYLSDRDGSRCLWARRLDPTTKQPGGEPFAVSHSNPRPCPLQISARSV